MRTRVLVTVAWFSIRLLSAQSAPVKGEPAAWNKLEFLLGKWTGNASEKDTPLGAGQGGFSFQPELNGRIIVRHNQATYTSGMHHDDLMVIYLDAPNDQPRAMYFDTEGHVIRYSLKFPAAGSVIFESDESLPAPRYRLSYWLNGPALDGKFEVAPPGADYKTYLRWTSKKD
jgi:hypothetical protein